MRMMHSVIMYVKLLLQNVITHFCNVIEPKEKSNLTELMYDSE
jgi:hypothetical protein